MSIKIPVNEIFGPVVQGEGAMMGLKVIFVRTGGCDYRCVWCDSKFTWDGSEKHGLLTPPDILREVVALGGHNAQWITVSGGNPALIGEPMGQFIQLAHRAGYQLSIETQGSQWQNWLTTVDQLVLSPKPPSSQMVTDFPLLQQILHATHRHEVSVSLKVVVFDDADYAYAQKVHAAFPLVPFYLQVGNDNLEAYDQRDLTDHLLAKFRWLADKMLHDSVFNDVRVLPQLHTLAWGNKRRV